MPTFEECAEQHKNQQARDCARAVSQCQKLLVDAAMRRMSEIALPTAAASAITAAMVDAFVMGFAAGRE